MLQTHEEHGIVRYAEWRVPATSSHAGAFARIRAEFLSAGTPAVIVYALGMIVGAVGVWVLPVGIPLTLGIASGTLFAVLFAPTSRLRISGGAVHRAQEYQDLTDIWLPVQIELSSGDRIYGVDSGRIHVDQDFLIFEGEACSFSFDQSQILSSNLSQIGWSRRNANLTPCLILDGPKGAISMRLNLLGSQSPYFGSALLRGVLSTWKLGSKSTSQVSVLPPTEHSIQLKSHLVRKRIQLAMKYVPALGLCGLASLRTLSMSQSSAVPMVLLVSAFLVFKFAFELLRLMKDQ